MPEAVLELNALTKRFSDIVAVDDLTEAVGAGEYFCILGPSGCGKTTLLRLIAGFEQPTAGAILLDGQSLAGIPPEKRDVNVVFQNYALFPHMSVFENVAFGLRARSIGENAMRERVGEALALVRLQAERERRPHELSGGQQQRVALARALVMRPRVLLLDEPLSALDRHLRQAMQEEFRRIHTESGLTFLHITHDQGEALALGNRIAVMRAGKFVQVAPPDVLYRRPAERFIAEFVGSSNIIRREDNVLISVRPEAVHITGDGDGFEARVASVAFAGSVLEVWLETDSQRWLSHVPARGDLDGLQPGVVVHVFIDPADVVVLRDHA